MIWEIRNMLLDIIEYVYKENVNSETLNRYERFFIEVTNKTLKSKHGDYDIRNHKIRIFNIQSRKNSDIVCTCIHELSHHIDTINRGKTDHSNFFYDIYKKILYGAFELGFISKEDISEIHKDSSDYKKVMKIIDDYNFKNTNSEPEYCRITVINSYEIKDILKKADYSYNEFVKGWEIVIAKECVHDEIEYLSHFTSKDNIHLSDESKILFNVKENKE